MPAQPARATHGANSSENVQDDCITEHIFNKIIVPKLLILFSRPVRLLIWTNRCEKLMILFRFVTISQIPQFRHPVPYYLIPFTLTAK